MENEKRVAAFFIVAFVVAAVLMFALGYNPMPFGSKLKMAEAYLERHPEFENMTIREALNFAKGFPTRANFLLEEVCTFT